MAPKAVTLKDLFWDTRCPNCKGELRLEDAKLEGTRESWKCQKCFMRVFEHCYEARTGAILIECYGCGLLMEEPEDLDAAALCPSCIEFRGEMSRQSDDDAPPLLKEKKEYVN